VSFCCVPDQALFQADAVTGRDGNVLHGVPIERILALL
jgi:hypothetical protein